MKSLILGLVVILSLTTCQENEKDKQRKALKDKIEYEISKGIQHDELFLGLKFGMTRYDVTRHLERRYSEHRITINNRNTYEYEFDLGEFMPRKAKATFGAEYYEGKLYKFILYVKSDEVLSSPRLLQLKLASLYREKYGSYLTIKTILDQERYIWIHGNRQIEIIEGIDDARIFYTDIITEAEKKEFDSIEGNKLREVLKNDI